MQYTRSEQPGKAFHIFSRAEGTGWDSFRISRLPFILLSFAFIFCNHASGQKNTNLGFFSGASYYMGDVNPAKHLYSPSVSAGAIIRYNFNPRNAIRFNAIYGGWSASDLDSDDPYQLNRSASFSSTYIDLAMNFEFNFLIYEPTNLRRYKFSPYVSGGLGYNYLLSGSTGEADFPFLSYGGGIKFNITSRMSGGAEWMFRKTFTDRIDGLSNIGSDDFGSFFHNNDWYSLVGIFITYKLWEYIEFCPAYDD